MYGQTEIKRKSMNNENMFEGTIPSEKVIEVLVKTLLDFSTSNNKHEKRAVMENFHKTVGKWEIVLLNPEKSQKVWLQLPVSYLETKTKFSLTDRIKFLMNNKMLIKSEAVSKQVEILSNVKFPLEISHKTLKKAQIDVDTTSMSKEEIFNYSIILLTQSVVELVKHSSDNQIAIYERPYGVLAMNRTSYHLTNLERESDIDVQSLERSMEVVSFSKLTESAQISSQHTHEDSFI